MRMFFAIVFPPLGVLLCGKPILAALNCLLTLMLYVPGAIHAVYIVAVSDAQARRKVRVRLRQRSHFRRDIHHA